MGRRIVGQAPIPGTSYEETVAIDPNTGVAIPPPRRTPDGGTYTEPIGSRYMTETTAPLAASATFTGVARDAQSALGAGSSSYDTFSAAVWATVAGTLFLECSDNAATWFPLNGTAGTAVAAGTSVQQSTRVHMRYHRVRYTNGATAQAANGFVLATAYTN